ncbi:hypothetical protein KBI23_16420 [bacterium]|nr:hypothetical protein [bacterium]MBP9806820.1 hypothetical protein [bacterium]
MADDNQEKGKLARLTERLTAGAPPTPEQIEESQRNRKALLGTARQWAEMLPTNIIAIDISQCSPDGRKSHGASQSAPGNSDYDEIRTLHKLERPGDSSTIYKRFIDGSWVVVEDLD